MRFFPFCIFFLVLLGSCLGLVEYFYEAAQWMGYAGFFLEAGKLFKEYFYPSPPPRGDEPVPQGYYEQPRATAPCDVWPDHAQHLADLLKDHVFGQHIAEPHVRAAVQSHLENRKPDHALSMVFTGTTGTGKNYVASKIGEAMFGEDGSRNYVHIYSGRSHFPNPEHVQKYRMQLLLQIEAAVAHCPNSIFVFDEIDKMPPGVIDVIKPYMDYNIHVGGVDYRKAIFIFLTNVGGKEINTKYWDLRVDGIIRDGIKYSDFERHLRKALYEGDGMFAESEVISQYLIGHFIPFLPLEKKHVIQCIQNAMKQHSIPKSETDRVVHNVLEKMEFHKELSLSGCKRVGDHVAVEKYVTSKKVVRS